MELAEGGDLLTYLRHGKLRHEQYVSVGPDGTLREQQALMVTDHSELMLFVWHIAKGMCHLENVKVRTAGADGYGSFRAHAFRLAHSQWHVSS